MFQEPRAFISLYQMDGEIDHGYQVTTSCWVYFCSFTVARVYSFVYFLFFCFILFFA